MQLLNLKTGQPEDVKEDDVVPILASGSHTPTGSKALLNPAGELVFSPDADVHENLTRFGYAVPTQAQFDELANQQKYGEGFGNELRAGLEGAARGATLGLSDVAQTALGVDAEGLAERRKLNPTAATVGEIGGAVGSALLAPGLAPAGLLARGGARAAARLAPEALAEGASLASQALNYAGQVGARAAGSAIEGAAYGLGETVTEAALGDPNEAAERLLANVGYGGLFGGALGGAIKGAEIAVPAAFNVAKSTLSKTWGRLIGKADEMGGYEAGPVTKGIAKAGELATGEPAEEIIDNIKKIQSGELLSPREYQKQKTDFVNAIQEGHDALEKASIEASVKVRPQEIGELTKGLNPVQTGAEIQNFRNKVGLISSEILNNQDSYTPAVGKALERINTTLEKSLVDQVGSSGGKAYPVPKTSGDHYLALNNAKKRLYELQTNLKGGSFADKEALPLVNELYQAAQESLKNADAWGETAIRYEAYNAAISRQADANAIFKREFMTNKKIGKRDNWKINRNKVNEFFNQINDDRSIPKREALKEFFEASKDTINELDNTYKSAVFEKFDKDTLANLVDRNEAMVARAQSTIAEQPGMGFGGLSNIAQSMASGQMPSFTGMAIKAVTDPYAAINALSNMQRMGQKTSSSISSASKEVFTPISSAASKFIGPAAGKLSIEATEKDYKKTSTKIEDFNSSPEKAIDDLHWATQDMYHVAPNVSAALQMTAIRGSQFLGTKIPKPVTPKLPFDAPFKPTMPQMIKFNRYYKTVHRPLTALDDLRSGVVHPETVEALQAVYPLLYSEMKTEIMGSMANVIAKKKKVPYQQRLAITQFLQSPLDSSTLPANIQANQVAMSMPSASSDEDKITAPNLGNMNLSGRLKTNIQGSAQREAT